LSKIQNVFSTEYFFEKSHNGAGVLEKVRAFEKKDFKTKIDFIDYVIVQPDHTIGYHQHTENEEIYFILKGSGLMNIGCKTVDVCSGDVVVNGCGESHGLINNSEEPMEIFIFQVSK
jgi:mannose-6-phosphate isomerase-like protein (cupin superfamily)